MVVGLELGEDRFSSASFAWMNAMFSGRMSAGSSLMVPAFFMPCANIALKNESVSSEYSRVVSPARANRVRQVGLALDAAGHVAQRLRLHVVAAPRGVGVFGFELRAQLFAPLLLGLGQTRRGLRFERGQFLLALTPRLHARIARLRLRIGQRRGGHLLHLRHRQP